MRHNSIVGNKYTLGKSVRFSRYINLVTKVIVYCVAASGKVHFYRRRTRLSAAFFVIKRENDMHLV